VGIRSSPSCLHKLHPCRGRKPQRYSRTSMVGGGSATQRLPGSDGRHGFGRVTWPLPLLCPSGDNSREPRRATEENPGPSEGKDRSRQPLPGSRRRIMSGRAEPKIVPQRGTIVEGAERRWRSNRKGGVNVPEQRIASTGRFPKDGRIH
jgi:hypothetical protein